MLSRHTLMPLVLVGALLAAAGVALGAFGAHGLEGRLVALGYESELSQRMAWFETGVKYQLYHALGLVVVANLPKSRWAGGAFLVGILLFSGSEKAWGGCTVGWAFFYCRLVYGCLWGLAKQR